MQTVTNDSQANPQAQAPPVYNQPAGHSSYNVQPFTSMVVERTRPENYLVMAILVTLCCCFPFGLIGVAYSISSSNRFDSGDDAGAMAAANLAKKWSITGLVFGIVIIVLSLTFVILVNTVLVPVIFSAALSAVPPTSQPTSY
ncbi:proline rich transmembrane protein 1B-like [Anneissia japonica]|uniref:proline rich transmembrane protein 1B-like n=1 Tax=Anneissia japonica TaxID=1529436 RepID=UPI00142554C8|nr:proline rich transmembrane protein 1B-like [Anneissia japonica]